MIDGFAQQKKNDLSFFVFLWNIKVFLGFFFKHGGILIVNVQHRNSIYFILPKNLAFDNIRLIRIWIWKLLI